MSKSQGGSQDKSAVGQAGERKWDDEWDDEMDARGLFCPEPVMMLHTRIADLEAGQTLKVIATDPSTTRDIPRFCQFLNHELLDELLENTEQGEQFIFFIRRGA